VVAIPADSIVRNADPLGLSDMQRLQSDFAAFALGLPQVFAAGVDNAMRWVVKAHIDANVCEPCKKNNKKTYRNRASAYADYPGGKGYIKCVGAEFGNKCRCVVTKRKKAS
jgi:hypothetical protein